MATQAEPVNETGSEPSTDAPDRSVCMDAHSESWNHGVTLSWYSASNKPQHLPSNCFQYLFENKIVSLPT